MKMVYDPEEINEMLEDDEIDAREAAFLSGYET